jgi:dihydroflavonol-4-reductase
VSARRVFVTGGTGFIGSAIVRALLDEGSEVRALVRESSPRENLEGLPVEIVIGDLADERALDRGLDGCDEAYHCAALYAFRSRGADEFVRSNVDGSRRVVRAAQRAGVERIVYTSSVATVAPIRDRVADESSRARAETAPGHYKRSKILAEEEVLRLAREEGAPVVVVNPSAPVGPRDVKPTPTGRLIVDFLTGRMPAYVDTGLNVVDVDDCARGHLLAARSGRTGERYILGGENLSLLEILTELGRIAGRRPPRLRLPHGVAIAAAAVSEALARLTGGDPLVPLEPARLARHRMWFDSGRARRELGYSSRPASEALARAVECFERRGLVPQRPSDG